MDIVKNVVGIIGIDRVPMSWFMLVFEKKIEYSVVVRDIEEK